MTWWHFWRVKPKAPEDVDGKAESQAALEQVKGRDESIKALARETKRRRREDNFGDALGVAFYLQGQERRR